MDLAYELFVSACTLFGLYLIGHKSRWAPHFGLFNNVLWWILVFWKGLYGIIPLQLGSLILTIRMLILWKDENSSDNSIRS